MKIRLEQNVSVGEPQEDTSWEVHVDRRRLKQINMA
jgi:hypothetical protein